MIDLKKGEESMQPGIRGWIQQSVMAHRDDNPFSPVSRLLDLDTEGAYTIQADLVDALPGVIVGYKAAVTAGPAQAALGLDEPIVGVLFDWCAINPRSFPMARRCVIETELGFNLARDIKERIAPGDFDNVVDTVYPMFEIASPNLDGPPTGVDMIATNSATYRFIRGEPHDVRDIAIDEIDVSLHRGEEALHQASSGTVLESQHNAIASLVNKVLSLGYPLKQNMLLMTGSIGPPQPAKPGYYQGDFGALGRMQVELR